MNVFGQLKKACLEILGSSPSGNVTGRIWWRSDTGKAEIDSGTQKRAVLLNDDKAVLGTNGTAANNVRFHRGANAVLQQVVGSDVTAEGTLSTALAQTSAKQENYTDAGKPAFGNTGRLAYLTDVFGLVLDIGSAWKYLVDTNTAQTLTNKTINADNNSITNIRAANMNSGAAPNGFVATSDGGGGVTYLSGTGVFAVRSVTTTDAPTNADDILILSGNSFTVTLFTAVGNTGKVIQLLHRGTSFVQFYTLNTTGGQTIGGIASGAYVLATGGESLSIVSDGTNWQILEHKAETDWEAFTPDSGVNAGIGTLASVAFYRRRMGTNLEYRGVCTLGTTSATEARFAIKQSGETVVSSSAISARELCGSYGVSVNGAYAPCVLIETSVSYMTFSQQASAVNATVKINGNVLSTSTQAFYIKATVPVAGLRP